MLAVVLVNEPIEVMVVQHGLGIGRPQPVDLKSARNTASIRRSPCTLLPLRGITARYVFVRERNPHGDHLMRPKPARRFPAEVLSPEEVAGLLEACSNGHWRAVRDRALIGSQPNLGDQNGAAN